MLNERLLKNPLQITNYKIGSRSSTFYSGQSRKYVFLLSENVVSSIK